MSPEATRWPAVPLPSPLIEAGDLLLRPWRPVDAAALARAWADPSIGGRLGAPDTTEPAARRWIDGSPARASSGLAVDLAIECAGAVVGEIGLSSFDPRRRAALVGYWVFPERRGRGIAAAALGAVTAWAVSDLAAMALIAECDDDNRASWRTAEAAGYRPLGTHGGRRVYAFRAVAEATVRARPGPVESPEP